jgi:S-phase kinase-associated protein 1
MPNVKVQSSDGEVFSVDFEVIKQSTTIKTMVDDLSIDDIEDEIVPLPNVTAGILKKVKFQIILLKLFNRINLTHKSFV